MNRNILFWMLFFISLAGCAGRPTAEQLKSADYGSYPENYQEIAKEFITNKIINESVSDKIFQARSSFSYDGMYTGWRGPSQGWYQSSMGNTYFGYRVCVIVHPKTLRGGLKSRDWYYLLIYNGKIIQYENEKSNGENQLHKLCNFK